MPLQPNQRRWLILSFTALYVMVQFYGITRAHFSSDKRFGFWMFAETTTFSAKLYRKTLGGKRVKTRNGRWSVQKDGNRVSYSWNSFVREYRLNNLEGEKRAKGSMSRTLKFLDASLDYVIDRIPADEETSQMILEVTYGKAGRKDTTVVLESKLRMF